MGNAGHSAAVEYQDNLPDPSVGRPWPARFLRRLLLATGYGVAVYMLCLLLIAAGLLDGFMQRWLASGLRSEVAFRDMKLSGPFQVSLEDVRMHWPQWNFRVDASRVVIAMNPFCLRSRGIRKVVMDDLRARYEMKENIADTDSPIKPVRLLADFPWETLPSMEIRDGRLGVHVRDGVLRLVDIHANLRSRTSKIVVFLTAGQPENDSVVLRLDTELFFDRGGWLDLQLDIMNMRLGHWYEQLRDADDAGFFPSKFQGTAQGKVHVKGGFKSLDVDGNLQVYDVALAAGIDQVEEADLRIDLEGQWPGELRLKQTVHAAGITNGTVPDIRQDELVAHGVLRMLTSKDGELQDIVLEELSGSWDDKGAFALRHNVLAADEAMDEYQFELRHLPVAKGLGLGLANVFPLLSTWECAGSAGVRGDYQPRNHALHVKQFATLNAKAVSPDYAYGIADMSLKGSLDTRETGDQRYQGVFECRSVGNRGGILANGYYFDFSDNAFKIRTRYSTSKDGRSFSFEKGSYLTVRDVGQVHYAGNLDVGRNTWDIRFESEAIQGRELYRRFIRDVFADQYPGVKTIRLNTPLSIKGHAYRSDDAHWLSGHVYMKNHSKRDYIKISKLRFDEPRGRMPFSLYFHEGGALHALPGNRDDHGLRGNIRVSNIRFGPFHDSQDHAFYLNLVNQTKSKDIIIRMSMADNRIFLEDELEFECQRIAKRTKGLAGDAQAPRPKAGTIRMSGIRTGDLLHDPHGLMVERVVFEKIDLRSLLSEGSISGVLNGEIRNLVCLEDSDQRFRAHFQTLRTPGKRQFVTKQAIDDLLFLLNNNYQVDEQWDHHAGEIVSKKYNYAWIDVQCELRPDGMLRLRGRVSPEDGKEYFIKGEGFNQINVVNVNPGGLLNWRALVERYRNVVAKRVE